MSRITYAHLDSKRGKLDVCHVMYQTLFGLAVRLLSRYQTHPLTTSFSHSIWGSLSGLLGVRIEIE
jgi:hypothetical protein